MAEAEKSGSGWTPALALGVFAITCVGAVIRAAGFGDSLFGDELSTYAAVHLSNGPGDVIDLIRADESLLDTGKYVIELTPPLYFVLAWASAQLGDAVELIRLPDLIAGILTIPLVFLVGVRTIGREAALFACGLTALSPFLIYESGDARAYALGTFLVLLAVYLLLRAVESDGVGWWAGYAVASTAVIYTHYTATLVLGAAALWALLYHRDRWRPLVIANLAAAVLFLPWLGEFLDDRASPYNVIGVIFPFSFDSTVEATREWFIGAPSVARGLVPGGLAASLVALGSLVALIGWLTTLPIRKQWPRIEEGPALVWLLALATPVGLAVYSLLGADVLTGRYFVISSPGLMLVLGMLLSKPKVPVRVAAAVMVVTGFAIAGVRTVSHYGARPDYKAAAAYIEARTPRHTPVFNRNFFKLSDGPLAETLSIYLADHPVSYPDDLTTAARRFSGREFALVYYAAPAQSGPSGPDPVEPIPDSFRLVEQRVFPGQQLLGAYIYERRR